MSDVDEGDNRGSTVQDVEQLHSDILKRKFDRYKDQIYVLVQSFNRKKNNELVELEGLKEFITELMFLIRIKLWYANEKELNESSINHDLEEYIYEIAVTELEVEKQQHDPSIDILSIFSLIEKFISLWNGEWEIIDLEEKEQNNSQLSDKSLLVKSPPKQVRNKIQDTINQYEELLKNWDPDDPAAIAYKEVINTLKAKYAELNYGLNDSKNEQIKHDQSKILAENDEIEHFPGGQHSPFISKKEHDQLMGSFKTHSRKVTEEIDQTKNKNRGIFLIKRHRQLSKLQNWKQGWRHECRSNSR
jgi:hypothetical protein